MFNVVRLDGKYHVVDKKCTVCSKCTKFIC